MLDLFKKFQKNADTEKSLKRLVNALNNFREKGDKNMKFKVGDKVRVVNAISVYKKDIGKTGTVVGFAKTNITHDDGYTLKFYGETCNSNCIWEDHELELVEPKSFTKADLKDGMVVETDESYDTRYLVHDDKLIQDGCYIELTDYNVDLTYKKCSTDYNIKKVYKSTARYLEDLFDNEYLDLLWERKEEPKPKYKVGDRVKMRDDLATGLFKISVLPNMARMACKISTNNGQYSPISYFINDGYRYCYTEDMIEGLVDYEEMTVAEIAKKLGYKVKIVDGE